jgi:hypothetical protein
MCTLLKMGKKKIVMGMLREEAMERRFFVEAKAFVLSMTEGEAVVLLEARRRGFTGLVVLGVQCTGWLVAMVEMVLQYHCSERG